MKGRGKRYLLTGGGTGGHVYPTLAIADRLKEIFPEAEFLYIGRKDKIEADLVPSKGYRIKFVRSLPYPGFHSIKDITGFLLNLASGVFGAMHILLTFRPSAVIAVGGYVAAPVALSCALLKKLRVIRCKLFLHEQNSIPGKMNQLCGRWADLIGVSFADSARFFPTERVRHVGYPIRREIGNTNSGNCRMNLGIPADGKVVFAFGASQGARTINRAVALALPQLLADESVSVIHATGKARTAPSGYDPATDTDRHLARVKIPEEHLKRYIRREYFHNIEEVYSLTDLVITRGGAGSLAEIEKCRLPAIVVPKSDLADDHQAINALMKQDNGTAVTLLENVEMDLDGRTVECVDPGKLADLTLSLLRDPDRLERMKTATECQEVSDPLDNIVTSINSMLDNKSPIENIKGEALEAGYEAMGIETTRSDCKTGKWLSWAAMGPFGLLRSIEDQADGLAPEDIYRPIELEYLYYRTRKLLRNPKWQFRNVGVKMAGVLRYKNALSDLKRILSDKRKASPGARLLGGDFLQVGFIRRNAVTSITLIGIVDDEIVKILLELLNDPYYEVRTKACESIGHLCSEDDQGSATTGLESLLARERVLEVNSAALAALGKITSNPASADTFQRFLQSGDWILREAALHGLTSMVERKIIKDPCLLTNQILLTCPQFHPVFPLRVALSRLYRRIGVRSKK